MLDLHTEMIPIREIIVQYIQQLIQNQAITEIRNKSDLDHLPTKGGFYIIYRKEVQADDTWSLRYVGIQNSIRQRVREHLFYQPNSGTGHKGYRAQDHPEYLYGVRYSLVEPLILKEYVEHIAIEELDPPDNKHS